MSNLLNDLVLSMETAQKNNGVSGIPSGFIDFDIVISGFQKGSLYLFAERPGMGLRFLIFSICNYVGIKKEIPMAYFSYRSSAYYIFNHLISNLSGLDYHKIIKANLSIEEWNAFYLLEAQLCKSNVFIDDKSYKDLAELYNQCRKLKEEQNIRLIIIDNFQQLLIFGEDEQKIAYMLKSIAKELDIPVIVLSELNQKVEKRKNKRPQYKDLGIPEKFADVVCCLYRPEYYGIYENEQGPIWESYTALIITKNCFGHLEDVKLRWDSNLCVFSNVSDYLLDHPLSILPF